MTTTTSIRDVRAAFDRYVELCDRMSLIPPGYHIGLTEGSATYGIAYRVFLTGDAVTDAHGVRSWPNGSGHSRPPIGDDFLGMTKPEAFATLQERNRTMADVLDAVLSERAFIRGTS